MLGRGEATSPPSSTQVQYQKPPARLRADAKAGTRRTGHPAAVPHVSRPVEAFQADTIREKIEAAGVEAATPAKINRPVPALYGHAKYKRRNLFERLFNRLENWRRIATRYDKGKKSYLDGPYGI